MLHATHMNLQAKWEEDANDAGDTDGAGDTDDAGDTADAGDTDDAKIDVDVEDGSMQLVH